MNIYKTLGIAAVVLFVVGAGCVSDIMSPTQETVTSSVSDVTINTDGGTMIPDLSLLTYSGKVVDLHDYIGKPLVINSWASWCAFCKKELPDFVKTQNYAPNDVLFIAINRKESLEVQKEYTDSRNITDQLVFLQDPTDSFYRSIGGFSMPETLFVDAAGNIVEHKRGILTATEIQEKTRALIETSE